MVADKKLPLQTSNNANIPPGPGGKTIEETYQKKSQLEHILLRPDTYIGSVEKHTQTLWVYENDEMVNRSISYVPGLYKIFDEILVNAADNKQRDPSMDTVKVQIDPDQNLISVYNNGDGVPVEIHQEEKIYVPEMIFGHLLTSSNYDDNERKTTGGRNGYGAKLTNIFSTEFIIETADGKRLKRYKQVFTNNMGTKSTPAITKCKANENWTKVTFKPDLAKFKMTHLEEDVVALMKKRVIDIAGCLGKTVKVELNGQKVPVKSFSDYCNLYLKSANRSRGEPHKCITEKINDRWEICVTDSDGQFQQVSFVNSIATIKGGSHVDYVTNQIANHLTNAVNNKKGKNKVATLKPHAAKNYVWIFVNALVDNPAFDSQTKETLTTRQTSFGSKCELSDDILKKIATKLDIVERLTAWAEFKQSKDLKKTDGAKRGRVTGIHKLEDANDAGGKNSEQCTLILTEGDSAKALAMSGLTVVGRNYYGVFPLRGKLLNVREASHKQIMENAEIQHLKQILGLQHGKNYEDVKSLRYGHLMIMTDQDHDGSHIKGLLINFIHSFWPSLLQVPSFLLEFITPIVKATKNTGKKESKAFYTLPEYESWKESLGTEAAGWTIKYYKGLGTSTSKEALEYFKDLKTHEKEFQWVDPQDGEAIEMAFSKKKIEARKNWLRQFKPGTFLGQKDKLIRYSDFVNKELILFSIADLQRSIPSMVDGLKPGQRKILFCCFKRKLFKEIKVAQFSGYVSEHSAYHHGETSLAGTIVGMAQDFVGSNNINLLQPNGMFGSRMQGGKDAASARYIHTSLSPITRALFPSDDDGILEYLNDDGQPIEPFWYIPVIPMVLVNGSEGIGTGWSSYIPNYNPRDIIANVRRLLNGEAMEPMHPWYRGFKGRIEKTATKEGGSTYTVSGIIEEVDEKTLRILELPIRKWTDDYKVFLESLMTGNDKIKEPFLQDVINHCDESTIEYDVVMTEKNLDMAKQDGLLKVFKLTTTVGTSNMHLFDPKGVIKKYDTPEQILEEFYHLRLEFYEKRKKFVIDNRQRHLLILDNKVRFILGVVRGEIIVNNRKRMDLFQELHQKGFTPVPKKKKTAEVAVAGVDEDVDEDDEEGTETVSKGVKGSDYDYLISLTIGTLTLEKVQKLCAEKDSVEKEIEELMKRTPQMLWTKDLDKLEKELDLQEKRDTEAETSRREERKKNMEKDAKRNLRNGGQARKKVAKKINNDSSISESVAISVDSTIETGDVVAAVKPKGRGGPRKAPAKKKVVSIDSDEEKEEDDEVAALNDRLAKYNINSSPGQSGAGMEVEDTINEVIMEDKAESDEEFVAGAKGGKKKGGRKPAAAKTGKPAAAATRKRGPGAKALNQKLITDVLKPAESTGASPDKKVRKIRASPFNKKSSSVLGRIGGSGENTSGGSSSSASGSPDGDSEVVVVKARPQRANRRVAKYALSESESESEADDSDTGDSEFDVVDLDENDD